MIVILMAKFTMSFSAYPCLYIRIGDIAHSSSELHPVPESATSAMLTYQQALEIYGKCTKFDTRLTQNLHANIFNRYQGRKQRVLFHTCVSI